MNADPQTVPQPLDDQLADYTDRLLDAPTAPAGEDPTAGLGETVRNLKHGVDSIAPDEQMKQRIGKRLQAAFAEQKSEQEKKITQPRRAPFAVLSWGILGVCVLGIVAILARFGGDLAGTAGGNDQPGTITATIDPVLLIVVGALVLTLLITLWLRSRR